MLTIGVNLLIYINQIVYEMIKMFGLDFYNV